MELTIGQLAAVLRMAYLMAEADGMVSYEEAFEMKLEEAFMGFGPEESAQLEAVVAELDPLAACTMIATIPDEDVKAYVAAFFGTVIAADGVITESEVAVWATISEICNLPEMSIEEALTIMEGDDDVEGEEVDD